MEEESYTQPSSQSLHRSFVQPPISPSSSKQSISNRTLTTELETSFSDELDLRRDTDCSRPDMRPPRTFSGASIEKLPSANSEIRSQAPSNTAVISPSYVNNPAAGCLPQSADLSNGAVVQLPLHYFQQLQNAAEQSRQYQQHTRQQDVSNGISANCQASPPIFNPATFPRRQAKQTQAKPTMPSAARDTLRTSCGPLYEEISNYNRSLPDPITTDPLGAPALTPDSKQFLITESASSSPQLSNRADTDLSHLPGNIPRRSHNALYDMDVSDGPGRHRNSDLSTKSTSTKASSSTRRVRCFVCAGVVLLTILAASGLCLSILLATNIIPTIEGDRRHSGSNDPSRLLANSTITADPTNITDLPAPSREEFNILTAQLNLLKTQVDDLQEEQQALTDYVNSIFDNCKHDHITHIYTGIGAAFTTALMPNYARGDTSLDYVTVAASCGGSNIRSHALHESDYLNTSRKQYRCECLGADDKDVERHCTIHYWVCQTRSAS